MTRSIAILLVASMTALIGAAAVARADVVYQWTDAHGEVHYTDQWVPGAKRITITSAPASTSSAVQGIQSESTAASRELQQQAAAQAVQHDEAQVRAARCTADKAQYQKLIQSRRIYTTDASGNRHYFTDAQADAARLKAREAMDADCGGAAAS